MDKKGPFRCLGQEDSLDKEMANYSSVLPGKSHRQRSLRGCSPWGHKELGTTELLKEKKKFFFEERQIPRQIHSFINIA